ncbi:sulfatase-like hydrolase/transferase [Nocardioides sp. JQ2195]|uniref:sulfatase-like hydrolase/transferase n=1 Tax=Nocardioides sp. JQ2195 TaxID=2592334 RepID=UPI00143EB447|nr:sulfatase-like hydrolase/transferase [Nocardioides sp. JQ2195]QIX25285.1 sulfatase-like hydrolase/transferase [Nocardioides sp. JQ2195]
MRFRVTAIALLGILVAAAVLTANEPGRIAAATEAPGKTVAAAVTVSPRPNIVLVLMDDFSLDLLQTMRSAESMRRDGASYDAAFVVDSLCCVSRSSLMTGQYPHQTGVLTNTANLPNPYGPIGGFDAFEAHGNPDRSVNLQLQQSGYTTGFVGKYLNAYEPRDGLVPELMPGWDEFDVLFGSAYDGWGFVQSHVEDGRLRLVDHPIPSSAATPEEKDAAYAGTVTSDLALDFLRRHRDDEKPFYLEVAPYGPHSRTNPDTPWPGEPLFPPAMQDRPGVVEPGGNCGQVACSDLDLDDLSGHGDDQADNRPVREDGTPAPAWKPQKTALTDGAAVVDLRNRARMVQSIDRMVEQVLAEVDADTFVVLTSDNGFHLGQHDLERGKGAPYASDSHVPLLVVGPGVEPGLRTQVVNNIDLAATFEDLAGLQPAPWRSGTSFAASLDDPTARGNRFAFLEHTYAPSLGADPDRAYAGGTIDIIPSYVAVRSRDALLVRLDLDPDWEATDFAWEFYDYRDAAFERTNSFADPAKRDQVRRLQRRLERFATCHEKAGTTVATRCRALTH